MTRLRATLTFALLSAILAPAAPAEDAPVTVTRLGRDAPVTGRLAAIAPDGAVQLTLASGESVTLAGRELVTIAFPRTPVEPEPLRFELNGGDVIHGRIDEESEIGVVVSGAGFAPMNLPLDRIRSIERPAALDRLAERPHVVAADGQDVVYRQTKDAVDRVTGTIDAVTRQGVSLETAIGPLTFGFDGVVAIAFSGAAESRPIDGVHLVALCAGGSRITGRPVGIQDHALVLDTPHGFQARIALGHLHAVYFRGGSFVFVSELAPARIEERSYFPGVVWHHRRDASVSGNPITLGGTIYPKGLGVHAYCALTYRLDGRFSRFRTLMGIDDEVRDLPAQGAVQFRVQVDGKTVYESPIVRGLEPPLRLDGLDVAGARELTLIVDFGDESHAGDRADWAMAILERAERKP